MGKRIDDGLDKSKRYRARHPERIAARAKAYRETHPPTPVPYDPEKHVRLRDASPESYFLKGRRTHLKSRYGLSMERFSEMVTEQGGVCAICGKPESRIRYGKLLHLVVDHDHTSGAVRSLLCHRCNSAVGYANESPEILRRAASYLVRYGK